MSCNVPNVILYFFVVNCPHQVPPPVTIMTRPFFYESGIALGTCDKVPMAKMIIVKDISIISHLFPLDWVRTSTHPYLQQLKQHALDIKLYKAK